MEHQNPSLELVKLDWNKRPEEEIFYADLETSGVTPDATIAGLSVLVGEDVFLFLGQQDYVIAAMRLLQGRRLAFYNAIFDISFFQREGVEVQLEHDPMMMFAMLQRVELGLKDNHKNFFNSTSIPLEEVAPGFDFTKADPTSPRTYAYMRQDVVMLKDLCGLVEERYARYVGPYEMDLNVAPVLAQERRVGVQVNMELVAQKREEYAMEVAAMERKIQAELGPVKIGSPRVGEILEQKYGVQLPRTKGGKPSAAADVLKSLDLPIAADLVEARHAQDVLSDLRKFHEYLGSDGRLHPDFKLHALSGASRLYAAKPSVTSIPMAVREAVIPDDGKKFVYVDWAGAEFIAMATMAEESEILEVYNTGEDLINWMRQFFTINGLEADREQMKEIVYASLYGSEGATMAKKHNISQDEAKQAIDRLWERFPKLGKFRAFVHKRVLETGYTKTMFGRPRKLSDAHEDSSYAKAKVLRQAVNTAVQSTVGDLMRLALAECSAALQPGERIVLQVFDSILFEVPEATNVTTFIGRLGKELRTVCKFRLSVGTGSNWAQAQSNIVAKRV